MEKLQTVENAIQVLRQANLNGIGGLPEELFLLVSSLTPIPNVDLLISDQQGRILLSWRNDPFFEDGWHIPGGCIRFGETMEQRLQKTAYEEIGCSVLFDPEPIAVRDVIRGAKEDLPNPNERGHNVTILFRCELPNGFEVSNNGRTEGEPGFLKWFSYLPDNFLHLQDCYGEILEPWRK